MGSTLSYNSSEPKLSEKSANYRQQMRRRDSASRPVLKLQICSGTMERHHRIHGETSLDDPFLRRLSGKKYGIANPVNVNGTPGHTSVISSSQTTFSGETSVSGSRPPSLNKHDSASSSMVILQFVEKGNLPSEEHLSTLNFYTGGQKTANEYDPLCLVRYGCVDSSGSDTSSTTSRTESPDNRIDGGECLLTPKDVKHRQMGHSTKITEAQSTTLQVDFSQVGTSNESMVTRRPSRKASVKITKRLTRTTSLQNEMESACANYGMVIELQEEEDWTFGESVLKSLEEEGILLFDIDNPTTGSEKVVDETWPSLKQKMHKWRSQQSLLDLSTDAV